MTAILEALLYAHSIVATTAIVRSDSLWAINVITGRWRAKHHKRLVSFTRSLTTTQHLKVHFQWVKGHAGTEGNERADKLAEQGKALQSKQGTDATAPDTTPATDQPRGRWRDARDAGDAGNAGDVGDAGDAGMPGTPDAKGGTPGRRDAGDATGTPGTPASGEHVAGGGIMEKRHFSC